MSRLLALAALLAACQDPVVRRDDRSPTARRPLRRDSLQRAADYLDGRAGEWLASPPPIANVRCAMSCHTTFPTVLAREALAGKGLHAADRARLRFVSRVREGAAATPFYGHGDQAKVTESYATEAVLNAAALALGDLDTEGALGDDARLALDRMWATQATDGAWPWLEFHLEPWKPA